MAKPATEPEQTELTEVTLMVDPIMLAWLEMQRSATVLTRGTVRRTVVSGGSGQAYKVQRQKWTVADEALRLLKLARANDPFASAKPGVSTGPRGEFNPVSGTWG